MRPTLGRLRAVLLRLVHGSFADRCSSMHVLACLCRLALLGFVHVAFHLPLLLLVLVVLGLLSCKSAHGMLLVVLAAELHLTSIGVRAGHRGLRGGRARIRLMDNRWVQRYDLWLARLLCAT